MKIALLTPTFSGFSGIDRVVELDAEDYIEKGNDVSIFTFRAGLKPKRARLIEWGMPKSGFFERIYRLLFFLFRGKIKRYARQLKDFDKVIAYFYPMTWVASKAKKKYGIKYTYWNAGVAYPRLFRGFFERLYMRLFIFFVGRSVKNADSAISISKFMQGELKRETGLDSDVKYIEIDKKRFHKDVSGGEVVRKKYNIGEKDPVFLYVGRISPHKGVHLLIKAFNLVLKEKTNAKLLIVGKETFGSYAKELKKLANPSVIFTGFVDDEELPRYYAACDIYTTATLWEGYDMPAVEAQACGKPVVAFDLASHPEVVKQGILVKPKDVNGFSQAVLNILKRD
ncbi:glycosyltransferase family 4 protein [Candidatus Woesearchaeota archaeon]|nr:glycosyltransferase family 4 protein [Candidatus Woesearchaeota archaeon]